MPSRASACRPPQPPLPASEAGGSSTGQPSPRKPQPGPGTPWGLLFFLLAFWVSSCQASVEFPCHTKNSMRDGDENAHHLCTGAPVASHVLQGEQDLQLWNEIDDVCSTYLTRESPPQSSNSLEDLCFMVLELLQKAQALDEKDITKRFLFHYSKTHGTGNSNILSSVLHPLLQLVPQLHERRLKRYKEDDELRIPGGIQSRGYFIFRPRNGRRSATFP